jgi:hypothetical protein
MCYDAERDGAVMCHRHLISIPRFCRTFNAAWFFENSVPIILSPFQYHVLIDAEGVEGGFSSWDICAEKMRKRYVTGLEIVQSLIK